MGEMTQAELYLLDQIRQGNDRAWSQFVQRYHGRLFAYARQQLGQAADAEDMVQEVFVSFIRALNTYRAESSVESFLFVILRRKIISEYRKKKTQRVGLIHDMYSSGSQETSDPLSGFQGTEPTASTYARRDEQKEKLFLALSRTIMSLLDRIKKSLNLEHLKIIELLFYCQLQNSDVAATLNIDAGKVGVLKHRFRRSSRRRLPRVRSQSPSHVTMPSISLSRFGPRLGTKGPMSL